MLTVTHPLPGISVVIRWQTPPNLDRTAFGFSAGLTEREAYAKAGVELSRNIACLETFFQSDTDRPSPTLLSERRLLHFSSVAGWGSFSDRLKESSRSTARTVEPPPAVFDGSVPGPWNRYTTVWRVLFEHRDGPDAASNDEGIFSF